MTASMPQPTPSMKVRAERAALADALSWVARALPKNPPVPVLAGIRVSASEGVVTMSAFDMETQHTAAIEATVGDEGRCVVPGLFFRESVSGGRGAEADIILNGQQLEVSSGRSTYRLRCLALDQAPSLPDFPEVRGVVSADRLRDAVSRLAPAIDDDPMFDTRGIHIEGDTENLSLVATDRYRFHVITLPWNGDGEFSCRIPGRALIEAAKGMEEGVEVGASDRMLGLSDGRRRWTTRLLDVKLLPWRELVDRYVPRCTNSLTVERDDFLAAVKQVGLMTEGTLPVDISFADGELTVSTPDQEKGDGSEVLPAEGSVPLSLICNHRFLADALAVTSGPVALCYADSYDGGGAFHITDEAQPNLTLIVMARKPGGIR